MKVVCLTHYFWPEVGAPQTRLLELARRLAAAGDEVTVVTGMPNYPTGVILDGYRGRFAMEERMDEVRVLRRWVYATPNAGFARRIANHISFVVTSLTALQAAGPANVIFVESPPLPIGIAALAYARVKGAPFVLNVSDVWPQSAVELGALRNRAAIRMAEALEMHLYRRSARVAVPTPGILEDLARRGVPRTKLVHLSNGVDVDMYRPTPLPAGRKVFMYAGTHGLSQGLDVIVEAAKLVSDLDVEFVLAGEGADKAAMVEKVRREQIPNVRFLPNQPQEAMPGLLAQAYATVITLRRLEVFKRARPSKIYESMACGRPIVASLWGEAADLVREAGAGIVVEPEDPTALAGAVRRLAADPELAQELGARGRAYVVEHLNRAKIAVQLRGMLDQVAAEGRQRRAERRDRALDLAIAVPALAVASPLIAAAAIAVKLDSHGPAFYSGPRVGKDGRIFRMHKLRTMRRDADAAGPAVTAGDDPRVTRVGRVLRRTKLDELPQLLDVVKGEMSLVGPRPEHPDFVARYTPEQRCRLLSVRPGITGPATLAYIDEEEMLQGGRAESIYVRSVMPRKLAIELDYLDHANPSTRLAILARTGAAILRRPFASSKGARARSRSQPR